MMHLCPACGLKAVCHHPNVQMRLYRLIVHRCEGCGSKWKQGTQVISYTVPKDLDTINRAERRARLGEIVCLG
jgi:ribosomal protein L37AE/L43A